MIVLLSSVCHFVVVVVVGRLESVSEGSSTEDAQVTILDMDVQ